MRKIFEKRLTEGLRVCIILTRRWEKTCSEFDIGELCNGSTTDSDSVCWGSNPYSPANTSEQFVPRLFYARILLFTAVFEQSVCVLCKFSFIFFKVYSVGTPMPMSFVPIKITRFFGFMFKALHSSLSNNLSLSTANNPAPIAPQNSGLSDMKIFVFNRFCNTFFKNVFSGRWNSPPWLATNLQNRIIFKAFALFWAEAFFAYLIKFSL